jgi:hypothetical protein
MSQGDGAGGHPVASTHRAPPVLLDAEEEDDTDADSTFDEPAEPPAPTWFGAGPGHPAMVATTPAESASASGLRMEETARGEETLDFSFILVSIRRRRRQVIRR